MRRLLFFLLLAASLCASAQENTMTVTYNSSFNNIVDTSFSLIMTISGNIAKITTDNGDIYSQPDVDVYLTMTDSMMYRTIQPASGERITTKSTIRNTADWKIMDDDVKILDYQCQHARLMVNSNTIDVWYHEHPTFHGSMMPQYGVPNGVVLKVSINNTREIEATDIKLSNTMEKLLPATWGTMTEQHVFAKKINDMSTQTIKVFENQRICFSDDISSPKSLEEIHFDTTYYFAKGTIAVKKIRLPHDAYDYNIVAELSQYSDGDAYDRTGSVFVIPTSKPLTYLHAMVYGKEQLPSFTTRSGKKYYGLVSTDDYDVPVELIRFYTPFGIRKYNSIRYGDYNWHDSAVYYHDVSDYASLLQDEVVIGVYIGNYDKNGHIVNLTLKYHPYGSGDTTHVIPVFNTLNIMEMAGQNYSDFFDTDTLQATFTTTHNIGEATMNYISTGHGGWGGGDEFNKRENTIMFNDHTVSVTPWRCDCAGYREKNPCSGNFSDGMSSSDYSRSGWCPGTSTIPFVLNFDDIRKGLHTVKVAIPQGEREGESFSYWNVSGCFVVKKVAE